MSIDVQEHASADGLKERVAIAIVTHRSTGGPPHEPRHRRPCDHRLNCALRRAVRHGLGHHECVYRHFGSHRRQILQSLRQVLPKLLLATAIGLVAAIPAVVIYNVFARSITGYRQLLADASAGVERLVSRDVDFALVPKAQHPVPQRQSREPDMAGGIRHNASDDDLQENHEINVTPFIDVMLVLLIIFMVAAPLATVDINVDLPASTAQSAPRPEKPVWLTLKGDKSIAIGDDTVPRETLGRFLDQRTQSEKETRIFLACGQIRRLRFLDGSHERAEG